MNKKLGIAVLAAFLLISVLYGWTVLAASPVPAASTGSLTGLFKAASQESATITLTSAEQGEQTFALAKSVWVYRNEQKAKLSDLQHGDKVELIMNSKGQAAYVKAVSAVSAAARPQIAAESEQTPALIPTPTPSPAPEAPPAALPGVLSQAAPDAASAQEAGLVSGKQGNERWSKDDDDDKNDDDSERKKDDDEDKHEDKHEGVDRKGNLKSQEERSKHAKNKKDRGDD
ncbi:hypothetical protein ACFFK0_16840 [Paenibacillus chartarius]|uniref:DUF5666 domain-containing protein n=1 Tax=Paenibacillus chartarius TaxID=747481 RepID=A0ABV6DN86_9BACL